MASEKLVDAVRGRLLLAADKAAKSLGHLFEDPRPYDEIEHRVNLALPDGRSLQILVRVGFPDAEANAE